MNKSGSIWRSGKLVPWDDARVHILAHALHYGSSVFEGMRSYDTPRGPAIFRLTDHVRRLFASAKICKMEITREALYVADEVFLTGSAAEITPVCSVDRRTVGDGRPGPVTAALSKAFSEITSGRAEDGHGWMEFVETR